MYSSIVLAGLAAVLQLGGGPAGPQPAPKGVPPQQAVTPVVMDEQVRQIYEAMAGKVSLDYDNKKFGEVLRDLREKTKLNFHFDAKSADEAGVDLRELPITLHVKDVPLKSALDLMLRDHEFTWAYRDDVVLITTFSNAETVLEMRVFGIADLVPMRPATAYADSSEADSVIEIITSTIAPTTWSEVGSVGAIKYEPRTKSLVISQTREVLDEVTELLTTLREARRLQQQGAGKTIPNDDDLTVVLYRLPEGMQEYRSILNTVLSARLKPGESPEYGKVTQALKESLNAAKQLAEVIPQVIEPETWQTKDGKVGGKIFAVEDALIIHQTARVHAEIAEFLHPAKPRMFSGSISGPGMGGGRSGMGGGGGGQF